MICPSFTSVPIDPDKTMGLLTVFTWCIHRFLSLRGTRVYDTPPSVDMINRVSMEFFHDLSSSHSNSNLLESTLVLLRVINRDGYHPLGTGISSYCQVQYHPSCQLCHPSLWNICTESFHLSSSDYMPWMGVSFIIRDNVDP